jgi:hypothetical protein
MKKKLITLFIFSISIYGYSQKIAENYTDEFTKKTIVRTDWEKISATTSLYLNVRICKVNETNYLQLKFFPKGVSSIDKKDDISFMFNDGEIINLNSTDYKLANYGDGSIGIMGSAALGFDIICLISESNIAKFKTNLVKRIRINKSEGYSESEIKPKNAEKLKKSFELMYK